MTDYDNTNSGVLFKNDKKGTDKHPDYTGKINVGGKELRLAAWIKEGRNGKFMSLKVSEFNGQSSQAPAISRSEPAPAASFDNFDDDIPF